MWLKKKSVLQAEGNYNTEKSIDGSDWRGSSNASTGWPISNTLPSVADAGNYFYLPALGSYRYGELEYVGSSGRYWSSTATPWAQSYAYYLKFSSTGGVSIDYDNRYNGFRVEPTCE